MEAPATVAGIDFPEADLSRSRLKNMQVTIDGSVIVLDDAFEVMHRETNALVDLDVTATQENGQTRIQLGFASGLTEGGSLIDGNYQLTIRGDRLLGPSGPLDGDSDGVPGGDYVFGDQEADNFFAYFGDGTGDRNVNLSDLSQFRTTFGTSTDNPNYKDAYDFNGDGIINLVDLAQFRGKFGTRLNF